jgi:DNA-binding response OmpR family regulator
MQRFGHLTAENPRIPRMPGLPGHAPCRGANRFTRTRMQPLPMADSDARSADRARPPVLFVVDDDPATLELLCEIGRDAGWITQGFTRLLELRRSLDGARPELLILDDDLPDGRGGDLARELREDRRMADVPTLVCTAAHPMRQAEINAWAPVVSKPFDLDEIEAFLGAAARRHRSAAAYGQQAG